MMKPAALIFLIFILSCSAWAEHHILKFEGVPTQLSSKIKQNFSYVFEREVSASEADQIMRYLMSTGQFSNIEVHERFPDTRPAEYVIVASLLRTIKEITVVGNNQFSKSHIIEKLGIANNQIFSRKEILANADELQTEYAEQGYLNPQIDIDFETPKESEIIIHIKIHESEPSTITHINFDCVNPEILLRAKKYSKYLIGSRLSNSNLKEFETSMKEFFSKERFLRAKISSPNLAFNKERNKVKINYVIENPIQYEFIFEGNQYFTDGHLLDAIELEKVIGATTSFAPDLADRIRKAYLNVGFANVKVDFKEKSFSKLYKDQVRFKIEEGLRVRIRELSIDGQISRPANYYSKLIRSNSSDTVSLGYYNRKDLENGQKNLTNELRNQGFLQNKVLALRTTFSKSKEFSDTNLTIDEGIQTLIKDIQFKGNIDISGAELLRHMSVAVGGPLLQTELELSIQAIKEYYRSIGYLEMQILNEDSKLVSFNEANTEAKLNFAIQEGPKVIVSDIEIQGLSLTKRYVVERELSFKVNDVLTQEKLKETTYHLQKLQLFSSVDIRTDADGTNIPRRTVIITVTEDDAGLLNPGLGLNNEHQLTYRGFLGFGYKNLGGTGRGISARGDLWYSMDPTIQYLENRETLGYFEPRIFKTLNNGRVNLTREDRFASAVKGSGLAIIQNKTQADFTIEREISRHFKITFYAWEFSKIKDFYRFDAPTGIDPVTLYVDVAKIGPTFEFDYRDDIFNPTKGTYTKTQFFYSDPFIGSSGDAHQFVHFFKSDNSITNYQRLNKEASLIWVNQLRGGYVGNLSQNSDTYTLAGAQVPVSGFPSTEAFALGGPTTVRGFGPNEQFPNVYDLDPKGSGDITSFKYTNETYYYLLKSEMRFPLLKVKGFSLGGAIFYDAGGVMVTQATSNSPDQYRDSAGFGIRVNTPVGPVNLDMGFKLNPRTRFSGTGNKPTPESPFAVHFTVGNF